MPLNLVKYMAAAILSATFAAVWAQPAPRKKVAVVLSGGGAKGMAHIGALKVIERAGIPIDYIVGTSMGSIVGGLYAIGYDAHTLDSLVRRQDWKYLLSDQINTRNLSLNERTNKGTYLLSRPIIRSDDNDVKGGLVSGHNLATLFSQLTVGYHDSIDFSNLPIPFACVATNMTDYSEVVIRSGWLSQAMRASMAIPVLFTPVRTDSMVLVDGGLRNNYPVDVARRMGADIVIGVTLEKPQRIAAELLSATDMFMQLLDFSVRNKYDDNVRQTDVLIPVDVTGYTSASFNPRAVDSLIIRGEEAATGQFAALLALRDSIGLPPGYKPSGIHRSADGFLPQKVLVSAIDFSGVGRSDGKYILRKYKISEGDSVSSQQLEQAMAALRSDLMYSSAEYSLRQMPGGYWLRIAAGRRKITQANLGVRFDTEEKVALQANSTLRLPTRLPMEVSVTGRLGKRYMANVAARIMPSNFRNLDLAYTFRRNDINIYRDGNRDFNVTYNYHDVNVNLLSFTGKNYSVDLGARWENFNFEDILIGQGLDQIAIGNERFYSYNVSLHYNSEDSKYFTTRGAMLAAGYSIYTDNFVRYRNQAPVSIVSGNWRVAIRLSDRLAIQPMVAGRLVLGKDIPWCLGNFIGGDFAGHYIEQQLPFAAVGNVEMAGHAFVSAGLKVQQRILDNNYLMLRTSFGLGADKIRNIFSKALMHGYQFTWAYNSFFGPVNANVGYSNVTKSMLFYLNLGFYF